MTLLRRRNTKSRGGPAWFPAVMAVGFASLAVWAGVAGDWLTAGIAGVMAAVSAAGFVLMRWIRVAINAAGEEQRPGQV